MTRLLTATAIAALALATPALASDQLARSLGVAPGSYSLTQLITLQNALDGDDRATVRAILAAPANGEVAGRVSSRGQLSTTERLALQAFMLHAVASVALNDAVRMLTGGKDPEQVVKQLAYGLTNKLIHAPTVGIRGASADGRADVLDVLRELYDL